MNKEIDFLEKQKNKFEGENLQIIDSIINKLKNQLESDMKKVTLIDFLNDPKRRNFYIPLYQREYRWGETEIRDFMDDLINSYHKGTTPSLGIFHVTYMGEDKYEVVDGQQRITTLLILLKAMQIKGKLKDANKDLLDSLFLKDNLIITAQNAELNSHYEHVLIHPNDEIKSNIYRAYKLIEKEFINNHSEIKDAAISALEKLTFQLYIIGINENNDKAYTYDLFLKLNARGTPLSYIDLIKTFLYKERPKDGENFQLFLSELKKYLPQRNEDKRYVELENIFRNYLKAYYVADKEVTLRKEYRSFIYVFDQWGRHFKTEYKNMCNFSTQNADYRKNKTMSDFDSEKDKFAVFHYGLTQHFKIEEYAPFITRMKLENNYEWAEAVFLISLDKKLEHFLMHKQLQKIEKFNNQKLYYEKTLQKYIDKKTEIPNVDIESILEKWTTLEQRIKEELDSDTSAPKLKQLRCFNAEWKSYIEGLKN